MLLFLFSTAASAAASAPRTLDHQPHESINRIVGDTSWVLETGRLPISSDSAVTRAAVHLDYVESLLRQRDLSALTPAQVTHREALLKVLQKYRLERAFPRHTVSAIDGPSLRPRFIDDAGRHCAVGHLIAASGHPELARQINAAYEYGYVLDIARTEPRVGQWASTYGFTVRELAMIQPSYANRPGPRMLTPWEEHISWLQTTLKKMPMLVIAPKAPNAQSDAADLAAGLAGPTDAAGRRHGLWVTPMPKVIPRSTAPITAPGQPKVESRATLALRRKTGCKDTRFAQDPACASLLWVPYNNGKRHGEEVRFDAMGRMVELGTWNQGKRVGVWVTGLQQRGRVHYNAKGQLDGKVVTTSGARTVSEGSYRNGKKHGKWTMRLGLPGRPDRVTAQFDNGVRVGTWQLHRLLQHGKKPILMGSATYSNKGVVVDFKPEGRRPNPPGQR